MAVPCTPSELVAAAKCFACIPKSARWSVRSKILCETAIKADPTTPCSTPSAPTNVGALNETSTTIKIAWKQPKNTGNFISGYIVYWGTTSGGPYTNNSGVIGIVPKNYTITGLSPGTTYFFIVVAQTNVPGCVSANSVQGSDTTSGSVAFCAQALAWSARIVANGGTAPSNATLTAVCNYYNSLVAAGVDTLMIADVLFVPDNLIAAITPFFKTMGNDPWTNHNFVNADLSATGLKGDGATKYLATGIIDNVAWASGTELGLGVYYTTVNNNAITFGSLDINNQNMSRLDENPLANLMQCSCFGTNDLSALYQFALFGVPHAGGFVAGVRQSGVRADLYCGNSVVAFSAIATILNQSAGRPLGFEMMCFAINDNGVVDSFSNQIYQWMGVFRGLGMTATKAQALFNAVQALQVALGRAE